jgi:hypothetical protein
LRATSRPGRRNVGVVVSLELLGVARVRDLIAAIHRR